MLKEIVMNKKPIVLITGAKGFTGVHLIRELTASNFKCVSLEADLMNKRALEIEIAEISPDYVVHLAAKSFAGNTIADETYNINVCGSVNLLEVLSIQDKSPKNVLLASSATVYGNQAGRLSEEANLSPVNHYGCSKLSMEFLAKNYIGAFPITITRPFNYTGLGHSKIFVIPKIVNAFRDDATALFLGNLSVLREYNDVRDVCVSYRILLEQSEKWRIVNVCSGRETSLQEVIYKLIDISGKNIPVHIDNKFLRNNEISVLTGDPAKLTGYVGGAERRSLDDTLSWMYFNE